MASRAFNDLKYNNKSEDVMFKKILVPLDGSELSTKILPEVRELAKCMGAQLTLLHVCHFSLTADKESLPPAMEQKAEADEAKECAVFMGTIAQEIESQGIEVTFACVQGSPAREIIAYAHDNKYDLIAMATHGKGEVAWILGSTAEKVVTHATIPTLLYRVIETAPPKSKKEHLIGMP